MSSDQEVHWTLGGISRGGERQWSVTGSRSLSQPEAEQLQRHVRLIRELAQQQDLNAVIETLARLLETLASARHQLRDHDSLSTGLATALALDLSAAAYAVDRWETRLLEKVRAANITAEEPAIRRLEEIRHQLRARPAYLTMHQLASRARSRDLELVLVDGVVRVAGVGQDPVGLAHLLMAQLLSLAFAYLDVFADALDEAVTALEIAAAEVLDGTPHLIRFNLDDAGQPANMNLEMLPMPEIAGIKRFRGETAATQDPTRLIPALGEFMSSSIRSRIRVGDIDIGAAAEGGTTTDAVNDLPSAKLKIDLDLLGSAPVDYWGPVTFDIWQGSSMNRLFTGAVQEARIEERVTLDCQGATGLTEQNLEGMAVANVTDAEVVRSIMEQAGLPDDALAVAEVQPDQPEETFEVFTPIQGITVEDPVSVGPILVVPPDRCESALAAFDSSDPVTKKLEVAFRNATSYARAETTATSLHAAEEAGIADVEVAMSWLIARERNGFVRLPDGRPQAFSRPHALRTPHVGRVVLVHGVETGRQWLRWPEGRGEPLTLALRSDSPHLDPELPRNLSTTEKRSLLAVRRAVFEVTVEPQLQALWEALESYAAGVTGPKLFSKDQLREVREHMPDWLTTAQRDKFEQAVGDLNRPPLGIRLEWRLERDAVPLGPHERQLLFEKLRNARNDVAHGRPIADPPSREEMLLGTSVVARIVLFGIAARDPI